MLRNLGQWVDRAFHWGGPVAKPRLGKDEALAIARAETERRGWPWEEPVQISFLNPRPFSNEEITWVMRTNDFQLGGHAHIHIADATGDVISSAFLRDEGAEQITVGQVPPGGTRRVSR